MVAFNEIQVGQEHRQKMTVSPQMIASFADATGDRNPIHFDAEFASRTRFGAPIAHGMLILGFISKVLGMDFPGPGTIYVRQDTRFLRPVLVGTDIEIQLRVLKMVQERNRIELDTTVVGKDGTVVLEGVAEVYLP
jgi:3-hydroxybutyryl-CoA dehydratase